MTSNVHSKRKPGDTSKLQIILLIFTTNLISIFLFSGPFHWIPRHYLHADYDSKPAPTALSNRAANGNERWGSGGAMPAELREFTAPQKLPLGYSKSMGLNTIYPSLGQACATFREDLDKYMGYTRGKLCPDDESLAQKLILKGCEALPRRRCIARSSPNYKEPFPFPQCMWTTPPNSSVVWSAYTCKDYACLIDRQNHPGFDDCKDCFDLHHREKTRWLKSGGSLDYSVDEVLAF